MWNNRYDILPTCEPIIVPELACDLKYIPWFRIHGKLYLYREEARSHHPHNSRPRRVPLNPRTVEAGPSSALMQELTLIAAAPIPTPPTGQYVLSYSGAYSNPIILTQSPYIAPYFLLLVLCQVDFWTFAPTESPLIILSVYGTQHSYAHSSFVTQTPPGSLFYQGLRSYGHIVDLRCRIVSTYQKYSSSPIGDEAYIGLGVVIPSQSRQKEISIVPSICTNGLGTLLEGPKQMVEHSDPWSKQSLWYAGPIFRSIMQLGTNLSSILHYCHTSLYDTSHPLCIFSNVFYFAVHALRTARLLSWTISTAKEPVRIPCVSSTRLVKWTWTSSYPRHLGRRRVSTWSTPLRFALELAQSYPLQDEEMVALAVKSNFALMKTTMLDKCKPHYTFSVE
ncbi:serine/threonine-protein phosphatase 7 long form-like protein [Gossypium australe]|uniref:Serine/threonine-protein phosphatase 7 long form-like protein n=1 Tax=Gossypium australe TaxID=47621 RepID=A0A5B6VC07_9ROSI|nr:serine/threonine-protein phosphatase 7 long form-like protein [Gossypium australe]